ncbi:MAG TPA: carboxymuconolactone decarboxylase family protein [Gammaproteobacteria bacterium]|nr:carboxymuconolactone decarboxylase family protein [Gammaproteobacteria bacterium]
MKLEKPRIPPLTDAELDAPARAALKTVTRRDGSIFNIFRTFARNPEATEAFLAWGNYILSRSSLPARDREILILRTGRLWQAEYEWAQHRRIGLHVGLTEDEIRDLERPQPSGRWSAHERALIAAADELCRDAFVSDATWRELARELDERGLMDLVFTVGQYTQVCMILNSFGVPLDEGLTGFGS